jgi:hypothetical protein
MQLYTTIHHLKNMLVEEHDAHTTIAAELLCPQPPHAMMPLVCGLRRLLTAIPTTTAATVAMLRTCIITMPQDFETPGFQGILRAAVVVDQTIEEVQIPTSHDEDTIDGPKPRSTTRIADGDELVGVAIENAEAFSFLDTDKIGTIFKVQKLHELLHSLQVGLGLRVRVKG